MLVEEIFYEDIREKKRIGAGVHAKTSRRLGRRGMRTASDCLSGPEKKQYTKGSKIMSYNIYQVADTMSDLSQFKALREDQQKEVLGRLRDTYCDKEIAERLNCGVSTIARYAKNLSLTGIKKRGRRKGYKRNDKITELPSPAMFDYSLDALSVDAPEAPAVEEVFAAVAALEANSEQQEEQPQTFDAPAVFSAPVSVIYNESVPDRTADDVVSRLVEQALDDSRVIMRLNNDFKNGIELSMKLQRIAALLMDDSSAFELELKISER